MQYGSIRFTRLIALLSIVVLASANAFIHNKNNLVRSPIPSTQRRNPGATTTTTMSELRNRSKNGASSSLKAEAAAAVPPGGDNKAAAPVVKAKKVRISSFDSMRFFLIAIICTGHFIRFADPNKFMMNFFAQINVIVGAFFVLSGYVAAYTSTENAAFESSPKLNNSTSWIIGRVFGYFPLHLFVLILFSPVFLYADVTYNGIVTALVHGVMSITMIQAWFPMHAEIWNAPSWFLSALTFGTAILPFSIPKIAKMDKPKLRKTLMWIILASTLPKLGYSYDHNAWGAMEGMLSPKAFPNLAIYNTQRFNPFYNTLEILLGVVACRLVMLDDMDKPDAKVSVNAFSTIMPLLGMMTVLVLRAVEILPLNDMLTRSCIFIPLFTRFMMSCHRASVIDGGKNITDPLVKVLSSKFLVNLGGIAFPIFLVHGPIGQIFYKKLIAKKLFGGTMNKIYGPQFFYVYLATVTVASFLLKKLFLENKAVGTFSKKMAGKLAEKL